MRKILALILCTALLTGVLCIPANAAAPIVFDKNQTVHFDQSFAGGADSSSFGDFDIKNGKLDMTVIMRSNDLIYGFANDQYCFSRLQQMVADHLQLPVGTYTHFAHDLHILTFPRRCSSRAIHPCSRRLLLQHG